MRLMLKMGGLVCLLCVLLLGAGVRSSATTEATATTADDRDERELISEGLGIRGVYVGRSTADDVVAAYGKEYELVTHGSHSYEMRYAQLDLSFYYCHADERKRIFDIECREDFAGFTAKGIVVGESTLRDVFKAYGPSEASGALPGNGQVAFRYPGIEFNVVERDGESHGDVNKYLSRKIVAIDVVTGKTGSDCLPPNPK